MKALLIFFVLSFQLPAQERPNILWITSEDNSSHWIGYYGNKQSQTPRIDALAKEGFLFENAFSNAPVCAVARAITTRASGRGNRGLSLQRWQQRHRPRRQRHVRAGRHERGDGGQSAHMNLNMKKRRPGKPFQI
jgi:hypothetical protein